VLAFYAFPAEHWSKLRSTNPLGRFNREIGRRTDVVGIFPDDASVVRLVSMLAIEANDEWLVGRSYISQGSMASLYETQNRAIATDGTSEEGAKLRLPEQIVLPRITARRWPAPHRRARHRGRGRQARCALGSGRPAPSAPLNVVEVSRGAGLAHGWSPAAGRRSTPGDQAAQVAVVEEVLDEPLSDLA
jgi:hypothetical protein